MRRLLLTSLVATIALACLPPAAGATTFHGHTSRGRPVTVTQPVGKAVVRATLSWNVGCRAGGSAQNTTRFLSPMIHATKRNFLDGGSGVEHDGAYRLQFTMRIAGHKVSAYRWTGTFRVHLDISRGGNHVNTCVLPTIKWSASVPQAHIEMKADAADYIQSSGSWSTPAKHISVVWENGHLSAQVAGWTIEVKAPHGARLRARRYTNAIRYPFNAANQAGLDVSGNGVGCNEVTGEFTVHSVRYSSAGKLLSVRLSFEHHCEGGPAAVRGTLSYRR